MPVALGILLSGSGSTYANLVEAIGRGEIPARIAVVVSSRADAYGLVRARQYGHPIAIVNHPTAVTAALLAHGVEWVAMCGYMRFYDPPPPFAGRTVNIHPALLPKFGGKGMYGHHVHEAVVAAGESETGCTAHLVAGDYDRGPILAQARVAVAPGDTADQVQAKVQAAERALYPRVLADLFARS